MHPGRRVWHRGRQGSGQPRIPAQSRRHVQGRCAAASWRIAVFEVGVPVQPALDELLQARSGGGVDRGAHGCRCTPPLLQGSRTGRTRPSSSRGSPAGLRPARRRCRRRDRLPWLPGLQRRRLSWLPVPVNTLPAAASGACRSGISALVAKRRDRRNRREAELPRRCFRGNHAAPQVRQSARRATAGKPVKRRVGSRQGRTA